MKNILVLIDGFNFYHRLKDYQRKNDVCVKWLNYKQLIKSYFSDYEEYNFNYYYFSAIAEFRGEDVKQRHETYINALKNENINIVLGRFKEKEALRCKTNERCEGCLTKQSCTPLIRHEEKNTDVNIAITLIEKAIKREYDKCYILSSDSDFNSAIKRAKELYPKGIITLVPPPLPKNNNRKRKYFVSEIMKITNSKPLFVSWENIKNSQFPDNYAGLINPFKCEVN